MTYTDTAVLILECLHLSYDPPSCRTAEPLTAGTICARINTHLNRCLQTLQLLVRAGIVAQLDRDNNDVPLYQLVDKDCIIGLYFSDCKLRLLLYITADALSPMDSKHRPNLHTAVQDMLDRLIELENAQ
jgi:hypothetical protein